MSTVEISTGPRWLVAAVLGLAGLFYAYAVWNAVAYLASMAQLGLNGYGWFVLLFAVCFPVVAYVLAWGVGRRRAVGELALVMLAGLGLSAALWMNVIWYVTVNPAAILG